MMKNSFISRNVLGLVAINTGAVLEDKTYRNPVYMTMVKKRIYFMFYAWYYSSGVVSY